MPREIKFKKRKERNCKYKGKKNKLIEIKKRANIGAFWYWLRETRPIDSTQKTPLPTFPSLVFQSPPMVPWLFLIFLSLPKGLSHYQKKITITKTIIFSLFHSQCQLFSLGINSISFGHNQAIQSQKS